MIAHSEKSQVAFSRTGASHILTILLIALAVGFLAGGAFLWFRQANADTSRPEESGSSNSKDRRAERAVAHVKIVHPEPGGLERTTNQPATLHAFEYADLYAKASGYLRGLIVDIGDTVNRGQVLAEVYDPEREQAVMEAVAEVEQAEAELGQARANVLAAEAEVEAGTATVGEARAKVGQATAARVADEKEYKRYQELLAQKVVDARVVAEKEETFRSSLAAENVALAAVKTAEGRLAKAEAGIVTSKADVRAAEANVRVKEAARERARILAKYIEIISPYNGVVTDRNYHRGDFIREATTGGSGPPILSIAETDRMRVVVYIPDADVPYLDRGDEAVVRLDALPGEEFKGNVARFSNFEMSTNRTMRAEIDLPNPTGRLRDGMYGLATILLEKPSDRVMTIPSAALRTASASGEGMVYIVENRRVHERQVRVGRDNGLKVEILEGLGPEDRVILSHRGPIEEGVPVESSMAAPGSSGTNSSQNGSGVPG